MAKHFKGFYFKSAVAIIDDNDSFLENLNYKLSDYYLTETYNNPYKALEKIVADYDNHAISSASNLIIEVDNDEEADQLYYSIDFPKIKQLSDERNKNDMVSVIIVDYSMPLMNGIEFCKKIAHLPVLKIMLTGHADFKLAVDAFNQGIIDKFLVKDTEFMLDDIKSAVKEMQQLFFEKLSSPLLNCFSSHKEKSIPSSESVSFFEKIIHELKVTEYFLLNQQGDYLLIKEDCSRHYFMTVFDKQLDEYIEIAQSLNGDAEIIEKMHNRTHAPFFINEADYKLHVSDWNSLLQPIKYANGYYYCIAPE